MTLSQLSGFAHLRFADVLVADYERGLKEPAASFYREVRRLILPHDPATYRGISRDPLSPALPGDEESEEHEARARFAALVSDGDYDPDFNEDLLPTLDAAQEVRALLRYPAHYEVAELRRHAFRPCPLTLGYDIGYWAGDHFSLICDSAVMPTWHPPQPDSFAALAQALRSLNSNFLFQTPRLAEDFRAFYCSQPWAETEDQPGEFCVIQVIAADPGA